MAGPSKNKSPKSPKKTRKAEAAAAPETKAAAAPETKAAAAPETKSVNVNNEDYNIRSRERTQLLAQIKGILNNAPVSPAFWACCQLADMDCLQELATTWNRKTFLWSERQLCTVPMQWNQRFRDSAFPGSEAALRPEGPEGSKRRKLNPDARPLVPRSPKEADKCKERDGYKCVLSRKPDPQAAHIFPHCMLQPRPKPNRNKLSSGVPDFWDSLFLFWSEDRVNKWRNTIFPDSQNPDIGVEKCFNLISLSPDTHEMWNKGVFALKPLTLSRDRKTLTVQFFWQTPGKYELDDRIDLLTEAPSSEGVQLVGDGYHLTRVQNDGSTPRFVRSGETITFTTKDPKNLPLPSLELLDMQWVLQRLVGMSGAAGWPSLDTIDDDSVDSDDNWLIPDYTDLDRVRDWTEEAADITPEMFTPETSTATPGPAVITCH